MSAKNSKKMRKEYRKSVDAMNNDLAANNIAKLYATVTDLTVMNRNEVKENQILRKKYESLDKKYTFFLIFGMLSYLVVGILTYFGV